MRKECTEPRNAVTNAGTVCVHAASETSARVCSSGCGCCVGQRVAAYSANNLSVSARCFAMATFRSSSLRRIIRLCALSLRSASLAR